jgi:4'-phosphopantetheinyl transferase
MRISIDVPERGSPETTMMELPSAGAPAGEVAGSGPLPGDESFTDISCFERHRACHRWSGAVYHGARRITVFDSTEVHVWLVDPTELRDPALLREYDTLMNAAERRKHDRYRFEKQRHESLVTRALVRTTLSRYCPAIAPREWEFVEIANGRPEVAAGQAPLPLRFNLSRTDGLIACAVALDRAIGVDVECINPRRSIAAIAERCFTPAEQRRLRGQPAERFYGYWTLKEAYVKARGFGLSVPLSQIAFERDGDGPISVSFDARLDDDPARWHFRLETPTPRHVLALAVEGGPGVDLRVRLESVVPLRS